jgi:hypothetical protein
MTQVFDTPADLGEYLFRITDNGGETIDRYTVTFSDGDYFGLNKAPTHPQGFSQSGEGISPQVQAEWVEEGSQVDLALGDLPEGLAEHIMYRLNESMQNFLDAVEANDPSAVADDRDAASVHEGLSNSFGDGLYLKDGAYMIRIDGMGPDEDYGPYETAKEALRATLPDHYSFSGPEYHSTVDDICRTTADPEVLAAVAALEEKVNAEYEASRPAGYFG